VHWQSDNPFDDVPNIEENDKHFEHLRGVNALVLDKIGCYCCAFPAKQDPEDVYRIIFLEWYKWIMNYLHSDYFNMFYSELNDL